MNYELIFSGRKTLAIQIKDQRVIVRAPKGAKRAEIERFLLKHEDWIEKHLEEAKRRKSLSESAEKLTESELRQLVSSAKETIRARVEYFAPMIGVTFQKITIRAQKTRWGSCSSKGNLSFNCLLMLAPDGALDSVVVHELCHLKEMNHSKSFYDEVFKAMPDYREKNEWLKIHGAELLSRLP